MSEQPQHLAPQACRPMSAPARRQLHALLSVVAAAGLALLAGAGSVKAADDITRIIRSLAPIAGQTVPEPVTPSDILTQPAPGTVTQQPAPPPPPVTDPDIYIEITIEGSVIVIDPTYSMDFEVFFAFDSAELSPRARAELTALGRALESGELRPYRYMIAGHTDAVGNPAYNQRLSERRAESVRNFLITNFAIHPSRLISVGFGEERLRDPANPRAGINRRVEVALIVPQAWR